MKLARTVVLLGLLATTPVVAAAGAEKVDSGDRRVCFLEARTGSNIKQRVCMTEAERERRRKEDQEVLAERRNSTAGSGPRSTPGVER